MSELDAERRERLAETLQRALWTRGWLDNGDARDTAPEVRDALAPLVAGWLADDDTAVCTTCQHRGGDDQPAQHPGCAAALGRIRAAALREAAEAFDPGRVKGIIEESTAFRKGAFAAWRGMTDWLRDRADRIGGGDE